jgi:hypothetical protein
MVWLESVIDERREGVDDDDQANDSESGKGRNKEVDGGHLLGLACMGERGTVDYDGSP